MIVVLIDTPENLEALHAHNTSLASKFQYIGSDEEAAEQKKAEAEMEAARNVPQKNRNRSPAMW